VAPIILNERAKSLVERAEEELMSSKVFGRFRRLVARVRRAGRGIVDAIINAFNSIPTRLRELAEASLEAGRGIVAAITNAFNSILTQLGELAKAGLQKGSEAADAMMRRLRLKFEEAKKRGKQRRIAVAVCFLITILISATIGLKVTVPLIAPIGIFFISLAAFHFIARWTYDAECGWRRVDYPWVLIAIFTFIVAIINMDSKFYSAETDRISTEIAEANPAFGGAIGDWITFCDEHVPAIKQGYEKSRHQEIEGLFEILPSARKNVEAFLKACDITNLKHITDTLTSTKSVNVNQQTIKELIDDLQIWTPCYFDMFTAIDFEREISPESFLSLFKEFEKGIPSFEDIIARRFGPFDKYRKICQPGERLYRSLSDLSRLQTNIEQEKRLSLFGRIDFPLYDWVIQTPWHLRTWYLALLFLVGLRLGKVTAEIKQVQARQAAHVSARSI
jgi:hypothetical protein